MLPIYIVRKCQIAKLLLLTPNEHKVKKENDRRPGILLASLTIPFIINIITHVVFMYVLHSFSTIRSRKCKAKGCLLKQSYVALHYTSIRTGGCEKKIFSNDDNIKVDRNDCTAKEASLLPLHYFSGIQKSA